MDEWRVHITRDKPTSAIYIQLCEVDQDGNMHEVAAGDFGPFDTALEVAMWLTRHWAPRARLPLR